MLSKNFYSRHVKTRACFLERVKANFNFRVKFILLSANAFNLGKSKILSLGKELKEQLFMDPQYDDLNDIIHHADTLTHYWTTKF